MTATDTRSTNRALLGPALAAGAAATVLVLVGMYLDTPWKIQGGREWALTTDKHGLGAGLVSLGFVAAGVAVVFGVVVARGMRGRAETEAVRSLALAGAGVLSAVVFWTGLPVILAAGSTVLAVDARARLGRTPVTAGIALALAALTTVAAINLAFTG